MDKLTSPQTVRDAAGRFVKGTSGNYRGRPKVDLKIRELAKANTEDAVYKLAEIMTDSKYSSHLQCLAATVLLDSAWRTNLMGYYLKRHRMTVWQFLNTPRYILTGEKKPEPSINNSEPLRSLLAIRRRVYGSLIDDLAEHAEKGREANLEVDEAAFEALLS